MKAATFSYQVMERGRGHAGANVSSGHRECVHNIGSHSGLSQHNMQRVSHRGDEMDPTVGHVAVSLPFEPVRGRDERERVL